MRNHDIASSSSVNCFFLSLFFICFSFLCMKLRNGLRVHTINAVPSIILGKSILCNGEDWYKTSFIRREIKMTPGLSRLI